MKNSTRKMALVAAVAILASSLTGCSRSGGDASAKGDGAAAAGTQPVIAAQGPATDAGAFTRDAVIDVTEWTEALGLTEQQRNSFSMLYHLAIVAEEIRTAKDNRLMLDDIYTSLLNDINPGAIDETTQAHLRNLRDIIKAYLDISVKRERLQYLHNQDKAASIRRAMPDPLAVLSVANALDWKRLAATVVYTVVDSYTEYKNANAEADREFLLSGWELDDEETAVVQKNRDRAFDYMVDIVQEYGLDGKLTLNEEAIETFAEINQIGIVQQKIRRLESEEETYKLLGNYWLELAMCYFENAQYEKCLECVAKYDALSTGIYRKDFNYVRVLPQAVVAAQMTYTGDAYIEAAGHFADAMMENTSAKDWSVRYFAAQVYLDLYRKTEDHAYLARAYNIAYDQVAILVDEQRRMNAAYLAPVEELTIQEPDYRFMNEEEEKKARADHKAEQKRLKEYNAAQKKARETELPALYEPFTLYCDLLFALAGEMGISPGEQANIEAILQTADNGVFLVKPVNDRYSFSAREREDTIELRKDKLLIPADLMAAEARVTIAVTQNGSTTEFTDCAVTKVAREGTEMDTFVAHVESKQMRDHAWRPDAQVTVTIDNGDEGIMLVFHFKVSEYKEGLWVLPDKVVFEAS